MSKKQPANKPPKTPQKEMVKVYGLGGKWRGRMMTREQYEAARKAE